MRTVVLYFLFGIACFGQGFGRTVAFQSAAAVQGTPVVSVFSPASVAGYSLDCDVASLNYTNGQAVTLLTDKSANGYHLISTGTNAVLWTNNASYLNSKPWIVLNGVGTCMQTNPTVTFAQSDTIFIVANRANPQLTTYATILDRGGATGDRQTFQFYSSGWGFVSGGSAVFNTDAGLTATWMLYELHFKGASSSMLTNGVTFSSGNPGTAGLKGVTLGNRYTGNSVADFAFKGDVARLVIYTNDVSGSDLTNLRTYFQTNYSLW